MEVTTSQMAQSILTLKGKPLGFEMYKPFQPLYDIDPPLFTIKAGRQIGKSVGLGAIMSVKSIGNPFFNSLYVAPLSIQTSRFSTAYLDPYMSSPLVKKYFMDSSSVKNVYEKSFVNGSRIYLSYAETESDADRIRGIMADALYMDEIQDISIDALPAVFEVLSASHFGYKRFTGTSKSLDNTLETMWLKSNQMEWVMKCPSCSKHIVPQDFVTCMKIVENPLYPSCPHCKGKIDVRDGQWISMRPDIKKHIGAHMPQFIMGANTTEKKWTELHDKIHSGTYNKVKLANEVFGLAEDTAGRTLSSSEAQACCNSKRSEFDRAWVSDERGIINVFVGVDWSVSSSTKSYTVISVLGYNMLGKCFLMYSQKLQGTDILEQTERVAEIFTQFNANMIVSDRGVGVVQVQLLQREFGPDRVIPVNYVSSTKKLRWDRASGFLAADRTQAIDTMVVKIKGGIDNFETPSWTLTQPYWQDALNIFEEESKSGKKLYRHGEDNPDDWMHSVVFANLGHQIITGDFELD